MVTPMITVLAGGVGAARFLSGLVQVRPQSEITAIVNTGDDVVMHGLRISPDLDTVTYTLAGAINPETGWGLVGETWQAMDALGRYADVRPLASGAGATWFRLGDKDLATHMYRTHRIDEGAALSEVTAEITGAWGLGLRLVPMTDDQVETRFTVEGEGEIGFQEYFVARRHDVTVAAVRFAGAETARPAPGVLEALRNADTVVIAPSNPLISIGPILAVSGIRDELIAWRNRVVAISPIVAGAALKGPADRLMADLGFESSVVGVARIYAEIASALVVDVADGGLVDAVEETGMRCVVAETVMSTPAIAAALAETAITSVARESEHRVSRIEMWGVEGIGEIRPGDVLADHIVGAIAAMAAADAAVALRDGDVLVVTQKIVSKAEGRVVAIDPDDPLSHKHLVEEEAVRIVRRRGDLIVTETRHGFVCANSGVDLSNMERGWAALLPLDSDRSARRIRDGVRARSGCTVGVIVSDTFGRAWRKGLTDVAIGCAGIAGVFDLRGTPDALGRVMQVTEVCVADELAGAAEMVMGKSAGIPVAVVRGVDPEWLRDGSVRDEVVRSPQEDLFR